VMDGALLVSNRSQCAFRCRSRAMLDTLRRAGDLFKTATDDFRFFPGELVEQPFYCVGR
jgi:hypothetical protein